MKLEWISSLLLLLPKSNACSILKSVASASLKKLSAADASLSIWLSFDASVPKKGVNVESLFSESHGDKRPKYGCEMSAGVASRETSVESPGGENRKFSSNVIDELGMKQLLSVDESLNIVSGVVVDKGVVAGNAKFRLPMSSRLKSVVLQVELTGLT